MDKQQQIQSQVKSIIMGANLSLEAHKYGQAKQICKEALELDKDNPNIYLIMLLADYKVTEIEDLKNCKVDFNSENYKNVRRYAGKELNDELNKYLSDKYTYDEGKSDSAVSAKINKSINYLKKLNYDELIKDLIGYDFFTTDLYEKNMKLKCKNDKSILANPKTDPLVDSIAPWILISLGPFLFMFLISFLGCYTENQPISLLTHIIFIGFLIGGILFFLRFRSIFCKEVIIRLPKKKNSFSEKFLALLTNMIGSLISYIAIWYFYTKFFNLAAPMNNHISFIINILALFIGLIPQRIIPFYYQQFYSFVKNANYLISE